MEIKLKHLEFIQSAISRMAKNSFLLRGWAVSLVAAFAAISLKEANSLYLLVSGSILVAFWMLDGVYLHYEKLFRNMYDLVRLKSNENIDFNMNFDQLSNRSNVFDCLTSTTVLVFYGGIVIALVILNNYINCK